MLSNINISKNLQGLLDTTMENTLERNGIPNQHFESIKEIIVKRAGVIHASIKKNEHCVLEEYSEYLNGFRKRHYSLWKKALNPLQAFIMWAEEIGEWVDKEFRATPDSTDNYLFTVLLWSHARAVQISSAVLCLLRNGFPDDAHARCRTLHELVVVSMFLEKHGQSSAKRYIEHTTTQRYKAMEKYQKYATTQEKFTSKEKNELEEACTKLINRYGKGFKSDYGWAAKDLKPDNPDYTPPFTHIEENVDFDYFRPIYSMESDNIHAGINFRLGLCDGTRMLLSGPSNYGLADPGNDMAEALFRITHQLLSFVPDTKSVISMYILAYYFCEATDAFLDIDNKLNKGVS